MMAHLNEGYAALKVLYRLVNEAAGEDCASKAWSPPESWGVRGLNDVWAAMKTGRHSSRADIEADVSATLRALRAHLESVQNDPSFAFLVARLEQHFEVLWHPSRPASPPSSSDDEDAPDDEHVEEDIAADEEEDMADDEEEDIDDDEDMDTDDDDYSDE